MGYQGPSLSAKKMGVCFMTNTWTWSGLYCSRSTGVQVQRPPTVAMHRAVNGVIRTLQGTGRPIYSGNLVTKEVQGMLCKQREQQMLTYSFARAACSFFGRISSMTPVCSRKGYSSSTFAAVQTENKSRSYQGYWSGLQLQY